MLLKIAQLGQPVLNQVTAEVPAEHISAPEFQSFLGDMRETLLEKRGAGLAAPQVFASARVFLAAVLPPQQDDEPPGIEVFINPRLTQVSAESRWSWEGCLSFPELLVLVERPRAVHIEYLSERGEPRTLALSDFPARVVQHELDHLNGVLTLDRAVSRRHIIKASEIDVAMPRERDE